MQRQKSLLLGVIQALMTSWICLPDQKYKLCSEVCPRTCLSPEYRNCSENCVSDCYCTGDKVMRDDGTCVDFRECPQFKGHTYYSQSFKKHCPPDEVFQNCGTVCSSSCESFKLDCKSVCVPGCYCSLGQIRNKHGKCIHMEDCFKEAHSRRQNILKTESCKRGEHFELCNCHVTCENYKNSSRICSAENCVAGCFCSEDLVKRRDGICVPPELCFKNTEIKKKLHQANLIRRARSSTDLINLLYPDEDTDGLICEEDYYLM